MPAAVWQHPPQIRQSQEGSGEESHVALTSRKVALGGRGAPWIPCFTAVHSFVLSLLKTY